jgi:hypothetical protein
MFVCRWVTQQNVLFGTDNSHVTTFENLKFCVFFHKDISALLSVAYSRKSSTVFNIVANSCKFQYS